MLVLLRVSHMIKLSTRFWLVQFHRGDVDSCFKLIPPDTAKIPPEDVVGVTVVLLTCSYKGQEVVRIGYYVNNDYTDSELAENLPAKPDF